MNNPLLLIFYAVVLVFSWLCWSMLARRLGYESAGLLGLGMMIPVVNLFVFCYLVFRESPNEARLRTLTPSPVPVREPEPATEEAPRTTCPACGATLTTTDARCPECGIRLQ